MTGLRSRTFVGTESRLHTVVELLRQIVYGAETDADARLAELRRRRAELDAEIAAVERGEVPVLDPAGLRDRYQQLSATARDLLKDFREVEDNFRTLDRRVRERIAGWTGAKGELLDEILGDRATIADSDQGRNFQAFYDFLLSRKRQDELSELLDRVQRLDAIAEADSRLRLIHYDWLDAAELTQRTVRLLSEQLRRFLDDQVWLENRRVMDILKSIEGHALDLRDEPRPAVTMPMPAPAPKVGLPMERPLYTPASDVDLDSSGISTADGEVDTEVLFDQVYVDPVRLADNVRAVLRDRAQVSLRDLVEVRPVQQGLAELVGYLALTDDDIATVIDERAVEQIRYVDATGCERAVTTPRVTYVLRTPARAPQDPVTAR